MRSVTFRFNDKQDEFIFSDKVNFVSDKKLIKELKKPNFKNAESPLIIKSENDLHIANVIQIKINLEDTGVFLASFRKEQLSEASRNRMIKEIGKLKDEVEPKSKKQLEKTRKLLKILEKYSPIYVSFVNSGAIRIDVKNMTIPHLEYPLLVLVEKRKTISINFKKFSEIKLPHFKKKEPEVENKEKAPKKAKVAKQKEKKQYAPIELFNFYYFFISLFSLLGSVAFTLAIFEFMNSEAIGVFILIIGIAFAITLITAMTSAIYHKGKEKNPFLRYYLLVYIVISTALGVLAGYFLAKGVLKTEIENFDYNKMVLIGAIVSGAAFISSIGTCSILNIIQIKIKQRKQEKE